MDTTLAQSDQSFLFKPQPSVSPGTCVSSAPHLSVMFWQLKVCSFHKRPSALMCHVVNHKHSTGKLHLVVVTVMGLHMTSYSNAYIVHHYLITTRVLRASQYACLGRLYATT